MSYLDALRSLSKLIPGMRTYTEFEISEMESQLKCLFPEDYKSLLTILGSGKIDPKHIGGDQPFTIEIWNPLDAREIFKDSFEDVRNWIGERVLPIGCDNNLQEIAAYVWNRPKGANFLVMSHEYYLDDLWDYSEEDKDMWFKTLADWVTEIYETKGNLEVH